jgi:hypothetical protein
MLSNMRPNRKMRRFALREDGTFREHCGVLQGCPGGGSPRNGLAPPQEGERGGTADDAGQSADAITVGHARHNFCAPQRLIQRLWVERPLISIRRP